MTRFLMLLILAAPAAAQTTTSSTGITSTNSNSQGNSQPQSPFQAQQMEAPPTINTGNSTGANVNGSNPFGGWYANPTYGGNYPGNGNPGGFGTATTGGGGTGSNRSSTASRTSGTSGTANRATTSGNTNSTLSGRTNSGMTTAGSTFSGSTAGTQGLNSFGSAASGLGSSFGSGRSGLGTTGLGQTSNRSGFGNTMGFGNTNTRSGTQNSSVIATQARAVSTTLTLPKALAVPVAANVLQADLGGALARSTFISNAGAIQVSHDNGVVLLRGQVKDEDEARTAAGIAMLTPGVRAVKNELTYP